MIVVVIILYIPNVDQAMVAWEAWKIGFAFVRKMDGKQLREI